jgi:hypothetical protein
MLTCECGECSASCLVSLAGLYEQPMLSSKLTAAVTAVAFADGCASAEDRSTPQRNDHLAVGLESGEVHILSVARSPPADAGCRAGQPSAVSAQTQSPTAMSPSAGQWDHQLLWHAPAHARHTGAVRRLQWRFVSPGYWQLASCSDDHAVRTYDIRFPSLKAVPPTERTPGL